MSTSAKAAGWISGREFYAAPWGKDIEQELLKNEVDCSTVYTVVLRTAWKLKLEGWYVNDRLKGPSGGGTKPPPAPKQTYCTSTEMRRGFASSRFGNVMVRIPFLYDAADFCESTVGGN